MSDEYVPTDDEVLDGYRSMRAWEIPGNAVSASAEALAEARRWLAAHDAQVRADALEEAAQIADDENDHWVADQLRARAASIREGGKQ